MHVVMSGLDSAEGWLRNDEAGLHALLMEIVLDPTLYEFFGHEDPGLAKLYAYDTLNALWFYARSYAIHYEQLPPKHQAALPACISKFHDMLALFWLNRNDMIRDDELIDAGLSSSEPRFVTQVFQLTTAVLELHGTAMIPLPDLPDSNIDRVLFYSWIYEDDKRNEEMLVVLRILPSWRDLRLKRLTGARYDRVVRAFVTDTVVKTDALKKLAQRICSILARDDVVDQTLTTLSDLITFVGNQTVAPDLTQPYFGEPECDLVLHLVKAWQRQACLGSSPTVKDILDTNPLQDVIKDEFLTSVTLYSASVICDEKSQDNRPKLFAHMADVFSQMKFSHFLACSVRQAISKKDERLMGCLQGLLGFYPDLIGHAKRHPSSKFKALVKQATHETHAIWRPTLQLLEETRRGHYGSPQYNKDLKEVRAKWHFLGLVLALHRVGSDEPEDNGLICEGLTCQWKDCLCSTHAAHKVMRVCKGCWKAFYCCRSCQKRDWQEHKPKCNPRQRRS